jgi:hypothetical protein
MGILRGDELLALFLKDKHTVFHAIHAVEDRQGLVKHLFFGFFLFFLALDFFFDFS